MTEEFITRIECEERKREDDRQNERIKFLEEKVDKINDLTISINTLATNMTHMVDEIKSQGGRIESLEKKDGDMWRSVVKSLVTGIVSLIAGYLFGKMNGG